MYKVYADGLLLYHPLLINDGYAIGSPSLTLEENRSGSFTFTLMPTNRLYNRLVKLKTIITVYDDDEEIFRGRILNDEKDFYNRKSIYCEGELAFLLDSIIRPYEFTGTPAEYFSYLITTHNSQVENIKQFKVGNVTIDYADESTSFINADYTNTWSELTYQLIDIYGGCIVVRIEEDGRYLDYLAETKEVSDQVIEFGINMIDITQYITAVDVVTRLIPLGALDENGNRLTIKSVNNEKDYIENETGVKTFGNITKVCIWDDVTDANELLEEAKYYLESNIEMSVTLTVNAIDLHLLNIDTKRIKKGDLLRVLSPAHGLDSNFRCSKVVLKLQNPENNEYSLGSSYTTLTEKQTSTNKNITLTQEQIIAIKEQAKKTGSVVDEVKNTVNTIYDNYTELTTVIEQLDTVYATIDFANIDTAAIKNLFADMGYITELEVITLIASKGYITELEVSKLIADKGYITDLEVDSIIANKGYITKIEADETYSTIGKFNDLNASVANINTLLAGSVTAGSTQTIVLNADNTTIANALIKDAMIDSLTFNKITGVDINTTELTIHSNDGKSTWRDNTIQIKDDTRTRVQIGKDSEGDFNIYIWDSEGKLMFDPLGLTDDGVTREVIDNSNVKDKAAIHGSKLDINSVITEINGSTTTIKSSKIYFDDEKQTLDVILNEMNTTVTQTKDTAEANSTKIDEITTKVETNTTSISVANGNIESLITRVGNTETNVKTIQDDMTTAETNITNLTTQYNSVKSTVDSHTQTIASHSTSITTLQTDINDVQATADTNTKTITTVNDKVTTVQTDLSGFKTTVNNTYATKTELNTVDGKFEKYSTTTEMNSAIDQSVNEIATRVSSVETSVSSVTKTVADNKPNWDKADEALDTANTAYETATQVNEEVTTVKKIVAEHTTSIDGITSRVSTTESNITTINGDVDSLTTRMSSAESKITADAIVSTVRSSTNYQNDLADKVGTGEIISCINQTAETIKIQASKIVLEGLVTANSNFKILADGSIESKNGTFTGEINATSGSIGGFDISDYFISEGTATFDFTESDVAIVRDILDKKISITDDYLKRYDLNGDGYIRANEYVKINNIISAGNSLSTKFVINPTFNNVDNNDGIFLIDVGGRQTKVTNTGAFYASQGSFGNLYIDSMAYFFDGVSVEGNLEVNGRIIIPNELPIQAYRTDGFLQNIIGYSAADNIYIGDSNHTGNVNIYGNRVAHSYNSTVSYLTIGSGDTWETGGCQCVGHVTSSGKNLWFTIPAPCRLTDVSSVAIKSLYLNIRIVGGGYVGEGYNGSGVNYVGKSGYTITPYIRKNTNTISIKMEQNTAYAVTNNTPVTVELFDSTFVFA